MTDQKVILSIALDYIEGWYTADASRMNRALSPHLAKRRIVSKDEIWHVDKPWMVQTTDEGKGEIENPARGRRDISILDQTETMACVKIISEKFIDYLHMSNASGNWQIVNVLWDYLAE